LALTKCHACDQEVPGRALRCPDCGATVNASPFSKFAGFYFIGGLLLILVYWVFIDLAVAKFLALNWFAVGIAVAMIAYGMPRKNDSATAGLIYLLGIGWLILLLAIGTVLIWQQGIGVEEFQWLLG
jgi:hypothetical protein